MVYMFIHYRSILIDVNYSVYAGNGIYIFIYLAYLSSPYPSKILFLYRLGKDPEKATSQNVPNSQITNSFLKGNDMNGLGFVGLAYLIEYFSLVPLV